MASKRNGTLYIGVTSHLPGRMQAHDEKPSANAFTAQYGVNRLVWWEEHASMDEAIQREKSLKKWKRTWKLALIEEHNPEWRPVCPETGVLLAFEHETPSWEDPSKSR